MTRLLVAIVAAFLLVSPATAEPVCGPVEAALELFRVQHGERPYIEMRDPAGNRFVILANPETGSWSLLVLPSVSETVACLVASGRDIAPVQSRGGRSS